MVPLQVVMLQLTCARPTAATCPCDDPSLCKPINRTGPENVYVFHVTGQQNWREYDWSQITTICIAGDVDMQLVCHAHKWGSRVTLLNGGVGWSASWLHNATAIDAFVHGSVTRMSQVFADGINLDIEMTVQTADDRRALLNVAKMMKEAVGSVVSHAHVTLDVPSEGLRSEGCGNQYQRKYPFDELAKVLDFLVVMDYDSNRPPPLPGAPVYRDHGKYAFATREAASTECKTIGSRLCHKSELVGHSKCAAGWCSDWEGYWMDAKSLPPNGGCGHAGFNPWRGSAGAYCCGGNISTPCSTCFYANAALPVVRAGVECFSSLKVSPAKLVLVFPWYGWHYTCAELEGPCSITHSTSLAYSHAVDLLTQALPPGRIWQENSSTPHFFYVENKTRDRVDYDDSESLRLKYRYAKEIQARGVGMWQAAFLNYSDPAMVKTFWGDFKVFGAS